MGGRAVDGPAGRARRRARSGFGVAPEPWTPRPRSFPRLVFATVAALAPVAPRRDPRGRRARRPDTAGPAPAVRGRGGALPEGERRVRRVRRGLQDVHGVRRRAEQPVPLRRVRGVRRSRERRVQRRLPGLRRGSARRERGGRLRRVPRPRRRGVLARGRARFAPRRVRRVRRHSEQRQRAGRLRRLRGPRVRARRSHQALVVLRLRGDAAFGTHVVDFCCACVDRASHWHALSGGAAEGPPAAHALAEDLWRQGRDALAEQRRRDGVSRRARDESRARANRRDRSARGPHLRALVLAVRAWRARARGVRRGLGHHAGRRAVGRHVTVLRGDVRVREPHQPARRVRRVRRRQRDVRGVRGRRLRSGRGPRSGRLRFVRREPSEHRPVRRVLRGQPDLRRVRRRARVGQDVRRVPGEHGSAVPELAGDRAAAPGARTRRRSAPPATRARAGAAGATACPTRARPGTGAASARCGTTRPRTNR